MVIRNAGIWRFDQFNRQFRWTLTKQARVTQTDLWNVSSFISDEKNSTEFSAASHFEIPTKVFQRIQRPVCSAWDIYLFI